MRPVYLGLTALVALVAGFAMGYLLGADSATSAPAPNISAVEPTVDLPPPPKPEPERPHVTQSRPLPDGDLLGAWMNTLGVELPQQGNGRITGAAALEGGTPLEGVRITATPRWNNPTQARAETLEDSVAAFARRARFEHEGKTHTTTGADGSYELTGLGDYEYRVNAELEGVRFSIPSQAYRARPGSTINFDGTAVCTIDVDVRMPDGSQPATAGISVRYSSNRSHGSSWHPGSTKTEVEPGTITVHATAGEHRQFVSESIEVEAELGHEKKITLQLKAKPGILCVVSVPPGTPRSNWFYVTLIQEPAPEPPVNARGSDRRESLHRGNQVPFTDLEAGNWRLVLSDNYRVLAWTDVTLGAEEFKEVGLEVPAPKAEDYVVVRVYSPQGELLDATFNVYLRGESPRGGSSSSGGGGETLKRPDGSYWILRHDPSRLNEGYIYTYEIKVNVKGYGTKVVRYPRDATHELRVDMDPPCTLTVYLPGATTHPLRRELNSKLMQKTSETSWTGISRTAHPDDPRTSGQQGLESDSVEFGPLSPGTYRFSLTFLDAKGSSSFRHHHTVAEWTFEVAAGANTQTCPVPALYTLTLLIDDPAQVRRLMLTTPDGGNRRGVEEIKKRTELRGMPAGEWLIDTQEGEMRLRVSGDTEVRLEAKEYNAIRVIGLVPGGKVEGMGLRSNDIVVAVDGEPLTGRGLHFLLQASFTKDNTTWTVVRNGAKIDVTFNGKELLAILEKRGEDREHIDMRPAVYE